MTTSPKTPTQPSAKKELIKYIAKEGPSQFLNIGNQEKAEKVLEIVLSGIIEILKDEKPLRFLGFGTFSVQNRPASEGRNPRTGDKIQIPAQKKLVFKAGKNMKEALNPQPKKKAAPKKLAKKK
jgi:DNA-binding protein HU-beta